MWAFLAARGSQGISNSHVCEERSCSPSGRLMMSGVVATFLLITGAPGIAKCAVAPASAIAISTAILILAVFIRAWGPSFNPLVIVDHAFARDGKGALCWSLSTMVRSCARLLIFTVTSSSSRVCCVYCVGVVLVIIFKQISLLYLFSLYAPTCHIFLRCHPWFCCHCCCCCC